jgi:hypothetical protein
MSTTEAKEPHPWYLGAYETHDIKARKGCHAVVLYGAPNWRERNPLPSNPLDGGHFDWKYVNLPCPACNFVHSFKRAEWAEEQQLDNFCNYFSE